MKCLVVARLEEVTSNTNRVRPILPLAFIEVSLNHHDEAGASFEDGRKQIGYAMLPEPAACVK